MRRRKILAPVVHASDVGRRVIQCSGLDCCRTARWAGEETAMLQGWRSRWKDRPRVVRVWTCPECWSKPVDLGRVRAELASVLPPMQRPAR